MAEAILMPKQGITVESCVITEWRKKPGDAVQTGEILFTYETDKAAFEVAAEASGTLLEVFFPEGEDIPVLTAVGAIGQPGEDVSALRPQGGEAASPAQAAVAALPVAPNKAGQAAASATAPQAASFGAVSPRARNAAAMLGVDASLATGTGPGGRVIERDVRRLFAEGPQAVPALVSPASTGEEYTEKKLSGVRRAIARGMTASLQTMAQLTLSSSFDATAILEHRKAFKSAADPAVAGITLTDMALFAVVRALTHPEHRHLNAHLIGETMRFFSGVHLAFAVDTPRGLLVPVIRNAERLGLKELSLEAKSLAAQCQDGGISPDLLTGGTFTVSNLGGLGIEHFTPVINPPQTGILGINNITWRPRDASGALYPAMGLSITFDHRAVDGAPAARFLQTVGKLLESFSALLL